VDAQTGPDIRERQYQGKRLKRAVVGSEVIDWLLRNGMTMSGTRQEAIAIATALLHTYLICNNKLEVFQDNKEHIYQLADIAMAKPMKSRGRAQLFGGSLEEIMESEENQGLLVPKVYSCLTDAVMKMNGATTEGVFRLSCEVLSLQALKQQLEKRNFQIAGRDPHVPANAMKSFLRELKEGLIPEVYYFQCLACERVADCERILRKIPEWHFFLLKELVLFLRDFARNQPETKMGVNNLAMIFAPCIIRSPSQDSTEIMKNSTSEQQFALLLLQDWVPTDDDDF